MLKTSQPEEPQVIVFDAYGTLFDVRSVIAAVERRFPGHGPAVSIEWRVRQLEYTWLRSLMNRYEDFWQITESALIATCNARNLLLDTAGRAELIDSYLRLALFEEVRGTLASLRGHRLAILSNGTPLMLQAVVNHAGVGEMFSQVLSADEVRTYKPNPEVYKLAVRKLQTDAGNIQFVSSNFWDIAGAKAFGFRTNWINRSGSSGEELDVIPDITLKTLSELPDAIQSDRK